MHECHHLQRLGFDQIEMGSPAVAASASFWHGGMLGGVLAEETDRLFAQRPR